MTTVKASGAEKTLTRIQLGTMGEVLAADHLTRMGLRILQRNWRCRYGELDVIACDDTTRTVVFVEVKTRTGDGFGGDDDHVRLLEQGAILLVSDEFRMMTLTNGWAPIARVAAGGSIC